MPPNNSQQHTEVTPSSLLTVSQEDKTVIVMGPTGAGKSTFIDIATSQNGHTIGHDMESHTSEIRAVRVLHGDPRRPIVFVDTPGFDDTYKTDTEILGMIANWLVKCYKGKVAVARIIYMHRISDNRMSGSLMKNLTMFKDLCGMDTMPKVIIATTMWSEVKEGVGERRETQMSERFWAPMLSRGCRLERFHDTHKSAWDIVDAPDLFQTSKPALLPDEIVDRSLRLQQTTAGITLNNELKTLIKARKDAARKLRLQAKAQNNELVLADLNQRQAELDDQIVQTAQELRKMKIPLPLVVMQFFRRKSA